MTGKSGINRRQRGAAKTWLLMALILLLAVAVPVGLYVLSNVSFGNGTTGSSLATPDTGTASVLPPPANARPAPAANPNPAAQQQSPIPANARVMDLQCIDAQTKAPIAGLRVQTGGNIRSRFSRTTSADGQVQVPIPADPENPGNFFIRVNGKGYIPKRLEWARYNQELREGPVPTTYTMTMEKGVRIHGKIVDDAGQPVEGANVVLDFTKKYGNPHESADINFYNRNKPLLSDADGNWTFPGAPPDCDQIGITAFDAHHVSEDFWNAEVSDPASKYYDGTATFVLQRGITLQGTVLGLDGSPLSGATVARGQDRNGSNSMPAQTTDASGHFSYQFSSGQAVILTFQARGLAPHLERLTMGAQPQNLTIHMEKAHRIYGKVVDAHGNGIAGAQINIDTWQGTRTLDARFQTDSGGNFHWNEAPAETVSAEVYAQGRAFKQLNDQTLTPDQDNLIKVGATSRIRGTVVDADTGQPINNFRLELGIKWNPDQQVVWQPGWGMDFGVRPGGFEFEDQWNYPGVAVRATASGYLPTDSRIVTPDEGDASLQLKMKPGKDLFLTVRSPDGNPLAGATAVLASPGQNAFIQNGRDTRGYNNAGQFTSAADGKLDIPPQSGPFEIAVFADAGFAQADQDAIAKSPEITLTAWGRLEGKMMVGSKPQAATWVDLSRQDMQPYDPHRPMIQQQYSIKTDSDGHFAFDRVSPGTWAIQRRIPMGPNSWMGDVVATADIVAGQTATVSVGGTGRPVVGKVVIPASLAGRSDWAYSFCQITSSNAAAFAGIPMPPDVRAQPLDQQRKWMRNWLQSGPGKKYAANLQKAQMFRRNHPVQVAPDGTFRVDDVSPGDYQISINISKVQGNNNFGGPPIALGGATFTVPPIPGGRSDDPLQIDPIYVAAMQKYNVGDPVADLPLRTVDGKNIKFSDYRGKYLLLDFFHPFDMNIMAFQSLTSDYGADPRLVMFTIQTGMVFPGQNPPKLNSNPWIQAGVAFNQMGWNVVQTDFDLQNSQGAWLIGPDGKVTAENLTGPAIKLAVSAALGAPQVPTTEPSTQPAATP